MKEHFTSLQYIDEPNNLEMISGPISYTKYSIFNNDILLKEIEIFGDMHNSEENNCTDQGELCIHAEKEGIVEDGKSDELKCIDIPTYLGYAILNAHKNKQYTDIYIESEQKEEGRHYGIEEDDEIWDIGYLIKTELFLQDCGSSRTRNSFCKDRIRAGSNSLSTRVSPNGERNWSRVHSGNIRRDTNEYGYHHALVESLMITESSTVKQQQRIVKTLRYFNVVIDKFLLAFTEDDLGTSTRNIFTPFYNMVLPEGNKDQQEEYVKNKYPAIHIIMNEFGGYYETGSKLEDLPLSMKRGKKGTLMLKRTIDGRKILTHRLGKTYSKVINLKNKYEEYELLHIMITAYEKFVSDMRFKIRNMINKTLNEINSLTNFHSKDDFINLKYSIESVITIMFSPLYDIYTIGRMISYPESERIIFFAGDEHCNELKKYIIQYVKSEFKRINNHYRGNINYYITQDIDIQSDFDTMNRCMRL